MNCCVKEKTRNDASVRGRTNQDTISAVPPSVHNERPLVTMSTEHADHHLLEQQRQDAIDAFQGRDKRGWMGRLR